MMRCAFCRHEVDPLEATTYQRVSGWERRRKGGGTNTIALRKTQQEWAHGKCVAREAQGLSNQGRLSW